MWLPQIASSLVRLNSIVYFFFSFQRFFCRFSFFSDKKKDLSVDEDRRQTKISSFCHEEIFWIISRRLIKDMSRVVLGYLDHIFSHSFRSFRRSMEFIQWNGAINRKFKHMKNWLKIMCYFFVVYYHESHCLAKKSSTSKPMKPKWNFASSPFILAQRKAKKNGRWSRYVTKNKMKKNKIDGKIDKNQRRNDVKTDVLFSTNRTFQSQIVCPLSTPTEKKRSKIENAKINEIYSKRLNGFEIEIETSKNWRRGNEE